MRPLRPLAALVLLTVVWLWWRAPVIRHDIARLAAAARADLAERKAGHRDFAGGPAQAWRTLANLSDVPGQAILSPTPALPPPPATTGGNPLYALAPITSRAALPEPVDSPDRRGQQAQSSSANAQTAAGAPTPNPPIAVDHVPTAPERNAAEEAYRALAAHDRRAAANGFREALAQMAGDPRAAIWRKQLELLEKRWSGSAYVLVRRSGASDLAVAPVLGGGQAGAQLAYAVDPLATRPVQIEVRATAPTSAPRQAGQAALGLAWHPWPGAAVAVERLFALGNQSRGGWTARLSGGSATEARGARWLDASAYGEGGAVGLHNVATYAAFQGRIGGGMRLGERLLATGGIGAWASVQHDRTTIDRLDTGPTLGVRSGNLELRVDYRLRVAGNARPGSGPALTVATLF